MASFAYNIYKTGVQKGLFDMRETGLDIQVMLVMTNTTTNTEKAAATISAFTTLDEYDGANYARQAIGTQVVTEDDVNNRGVFDGDDVTFAALGAGSRQAQAMLIFDHVGADSANIPIAYIDTGGFPFSGNGGDVTVTWNANGIIQAT